MTQDIDKKIIILKENEQFEWSLVFSMIKELTLKIDIDLVINNLCIELRYFYSCM